MSPISAATPVAAPVAVRAPLESLARLVIKDGVSLGLLSEAERQLASAWAAERRAAHEAERNARRERWARQQTPLASA